MDGVIAVDKSIGETSAKTVARLKRLLEARKAGHGGTLDPMASGVLVVLLGRATALSRFVLHGDKRYRAAVRFGLKTDSDDGDGAAVERKPVPASLRDDIEKYLPRFVGDIMQTAPQYSALKHRGRPLYYYARRGLEAPDKTRPVTVREILPIGVDGDTAVFEITCGGGFYVRAFARDLGAAVGCGAHLSFLRRLESGGFRVSAAATVEQLEKMPAAGRQAAVLPMESVLAHLPPCRLPAAALDKLSLGTAVDCDGDDGWRRVYSAAEQFAGVAAAKNRRLYSAMLLPWTRQRRI